jgi:hypothetical protein
MSVPLSNLSATWNAIGTTFTAIRMAVTDSASAAGSKLMDLIVGSTHMFQIRKDGHAAAGAGSEIDYFPFFGGSYPTTLTVSETVNSNLTQDIFGLTTTLTYDPTADTGYNLTGAQIAAYIPDTSALNFAASMTGFNWNASAQNGGHIDSIYAGNGQAQKVGGTVDAIYGVDQIIQLADASATEMWGFQAAMTFTNAAHADSAFSFSSKVFPFGSTWSVDVFYGYWSEDISQYSARITNPYYWWTNGPGVTRIREEGSPKGAVYSWYNPNFTKYTPGAVNFERGVLQWNTGDILEIGAEAGGTGTLRKVRHLGAGHIFPLANLPTSDPGVAGQLFTSGAPSAGVPKALMISGG